MSAPEFSRLIKLRQLPTDIELTANETELTALAARFGVTAVHALSATIAFDRDGQATLANGTLRAEIEQPCAISGEDFRYSVTEPLALRFVSAPEHAAGGFDEEIELDSAVLDDIEYDGEAFDLGEAISQTLGLAIDPYAEGPEAEAARAAGLVSSEEACGPFAALAALKSKD